MRLSAWARQTGVSYKTAWRIWKAGTLPVRAEQLATGTVIVHAPAASTESGGCALFAVSKKLRISDAVKETGSGLHGRRKGLLRLLCDPSAQTIVVEHRDRLMRLDLSM